MGKNRFQNSIILFIKSLEMTRVYLPISTFLAVLFCTTFSFAQNAISPVALKVQQAKQTQQSLPNVQLFDLANNLDALPEARNTLKKATVLDLRMEDLKAAFGTKADFIEFTLPSFEEEDFTLELVRHETLSDDFRVTTSSSNGEAIPYEAGIHYRGIVKGNNQSLAAISIFKDEIIGVVSTLNDGEMVIGKTSSRAENDQYIFYKEKDLLITNDFECGTDELDMSKIDLKKLQDIANTNSIESAANCVKVYIECEHDLYLEKGSVANSVNYMTGLFNVVATLYQNESITTQTSEIFVWDTPDSYPTNSTSNALTAFRNTRTSFNGDLAHLVSRGAPSGGGVAWVDALCTSYNYAYSYINSTYQVFPTYSWSVEVFTHEMGHNLGSPHTHACAWNGNNTAIDGCGPAAGANEGCNAPLPQEGTIMSYCHLVGGVGINFNLGFGPQPGNLIRAEVNNASCLSSCGPPCTLSATVTGTNANNGNNGTATITASGGTTPYTYAWSNGGSTATITGLAPGTYSGTVTDNTGCTASGSYTVQNTTPCSDNELTLTIVLDNYPGETSWEVRDANNNVVTSSNGTYSGNAPGSTVTETLCIPNGCYDFIIYDSYGDGICCAYGSGSYDLVENTTGTSLASGGQFNSSETTNFCVPTGTTPLSVSITNSTNVSCNGGNDGSATALAAGGTAPYSYAWSNGGGTSASASNLTAGSYTVTATDNAGATATVSVTISQPSALNLSIVGTNATNGNNGAADLTVSGGTPSYLYDWDNDGTGDNDDPEDLTGLAPGTYTVIVTDANGCTETASVTIENNSGGGCNDNEVTLTINLDNYPGETTWEINDSNGSTVASGGPYSVVGGTETIALCLPDDCYDFIIFDSYGDGICCAYGSGSYNLTDDATGTILASGGAFGSSETTNFCLPAGGGGCSYAVIDDENFESGWGIWNDGGSDCRRSINDQAYANSGSYCVRLRDNTSSSVMTTDLLDLTGYDELTIDFSYYVRSFEGTEDFWLQISTNGGSSYTTVEDWVRTVDFNNNERKSGSVVIAGPFTTNTRLRFRADASGNSDWVYIDDVVINGCGSTGNMFNEIPVITEPEITEEIDRTILEIKPASMRLFPNPVSTELTVAYKTNTTENVQLRLMDFTGQVIQVMNTPSGYFEEKIDVSNLNSGYYVIQMIAGKERLTQKFVVTK